ncbi:MAG: Asp23/Gls24 family envelope stress response protein [Coriobacteriia bacterium]|nr:Asp23/Gls24 family envelope stress response protein [Coriobacteriia bacterium]MBN2840631.1 Asp23/Gls24 family envelope stress response protein [Coriobacteriia bacterium]
MSEEITLDGIGVAPGVLETIAQISAQSVDGVAHIVTSGSGLAGLVPKGAARGVIVEIGEDGALTASIHISALYGRPLREVATDVQRAVTDALLTHTGQAVASVDVFVDGVVFPEQ